MQTKPVRMLLRHNDWKRIMPFLLIPRKKRKGGILTSGNAFSTFVSSLRQPVECFFNWLNRLTNIQSASMVRSLSGLLLHIFARITAALAALLFNS